MLITLLHPRSCLNQPPSLPPVIDNQGNLPGNALLNYHVIKLSCRNFVFKIKTRKGSSLLVKQTPSLMK